MLRSICALQRNGNVVRTFAKAVVIILPDLGHRNADLFRGIGSRDGITIFRISAYGHFVAVHIRRYSCIGYLGACLVFRQFSVFRLTRPFPVSVSVRFRGVYADFFRAVCKDRYTQVFRTFTIPVIIILPDDCPFKRTELHRTVAIPDDKAIFCGPCNRRSVLRYFLFRYCVADLAAVLVLRNAGEAAAPGFIRVFR